MWNHVGKWAKTSSGLPSTSGKIKLKRKFVKKKKKINVFSLQVVQQALCLYVEIKYILVMLEILLLY